MKYSLRDYQIELIEQILSSWRTNRRVMMQLATGGGKTVIFAHLALEFLKKNMGVVVLAHREELLLQAKEKLEEVTGLPAGIIKSGHPFHSLWDLQVASVQSLVRRKHTPDAGLLIVDEAHHASSKTYTSLMERYPDAYILGCTATPHRIDGQGFKWLFDDLVTGPSTKDLIDRGHLAPYKLFQAAKTADTNKVKVLGGDFSINQLAESVSNQIEPIDVVSEWQKRALGKKTVIFAVDIARSIQYRDAFLAANIPAEHLDGATPSQERKEILARFASGQTLVLTNCGIISEGFDLPSIEVVQVVRPTKSLSMWLQILGRGLRTAEGKESAIVIDHTKNWQLLGLPDDDQEWSLEPISLDKNDIEEDYKRFSHVHCDNCDHIYKQSHDELLAAKQSARITYQYSTKTRKNEKYHIGNSICPNCLANNEFLTGNGGSSSSKILDANEEEHEVDLTVDAWHQEIIDSLIEQQRDFGHKVAWVVFRVTELPQINPKFDLKAMSLGDWRYLASKLGYKTGWAFIKWQEAQTGESFDNPNHWSKTPIFDGLISNLQHSKPIKKSGLRSADLNREI